MIGYHHGKITDEKVIGELEDVNKKFGLLAPKAVVDKARPETSALHPFFEWEDSEAAEAYRREQARNLIRCVYIEMKPGEFAPAYVSIPSDRSTEGGGYRSTKIVLSDKKMSEELLQEALRTLIYFREKYSRLKQLSSIMIAIDKLPLIKKMKKKEG